MEHDSVNSLCLKHTQMQIRDQREFVLICLYSPTYAAQTYNKPRQCFWLTKTTKVHQEDCRKAFLLSGREFTFADLWQEVLFISDRLSIIFKKTLEIRQQLCISFNQESFCCFYKSVTRDLQDLQW